MNLVHAAPLGLLTLALSGCHPTVSFEMDVKGSSTVQGSALGALLSAFPQMATFSNMNFSDTQDFKNQGVHKEDVKTVKLKHLTLQITSPNDMDFSWLQSIQFSASAANEAKVKVAEKANIDQLGLTAPNPKLDLDVADVELAPYVTAESMSLGTDVTAHQPSKDTTLEATAHFAVEAFLIK